MNKIRAFIAVDVSNTTAIEKLQQELVCDTGWALDETMPVKRNNLHFTLIFLGNISFDRIEEIKNSISGLQFQPIKITFSGIGVFPSPNLARVVWVGVDEYSHQRLAGLAEQLFLKLSEIGISPDKPFVPHLTIFRIKGRKLKIGTDLLYKYGKKNFGSDISDKVHLKRSDLSQSGPIYSNIFTVPAR